MLVREDFSSAELFAYRQNFTNVGRMAANSRGTFEENITIIIAPGKVLHNMVRILARRQAAIKN